MRSSFFIVYGKKIYFCTWLIFSQNILGLLSPKWHNYACNFDFRDTVKPKCSMEQTWEIYKIQFNKQNVGSSGNINFNKQSILITVQKTKRFS